MPNAAPPVDMRSAHCRNCGAAASANFCPDCGQETCVALPTTVEFVREAAGRLVALDGRLWRTLYVLVFRPGLLTREYLAGRRRRYVRPARLFVVLSLAVFAVIGLVSSPASISDGVIIDSGDANRPAANSPGGRPEDAKLAAGRKAKTPAAAEAGARSGRGANYVALDEDLNLQIRVNGTDQQLPAELRKRYERLKGMSREDRAEHIYAGMLRYGPTMVVLMVPVFALLLKLAYLGRGGRYPGRPQRYAEHLVYSAHLHAFAALMVMVLAVMPFGWTRAAIAIWIVYYVLRARSLVYGGRRWAGLLRAFVVAVVYSIFAAMGVASLVVAAAMMR